MRVCRHNEIFSDERPVVVLGYFDGMHTAHRELFRLAKKSPSPCAAITFAGEKTPYITSESEKLKLFEESGVDTV